MNEQEFWEIIGRLDPEGSDDVAIVGPAIERLALASEEQICEFQELLAEKLYRVDGEAWAKSIGEKAFNGRPTEFDADHFLHARCGLIANGEDLYNFVLRNPHRFPQDVVFPQNY